MPEYGPFVVAARDILQCDTAFDWFLSEYESCNLAHAVSQSHRHFGLAASEMAFHCSCLQQCCLDRFMCTCSLTPASLCQCLNQFLQSAAQVLCVAQFTESHWSPVLVVRNDAHVWIAVESCAVHFLPMIPAAFIRIIPGPVSQCCGAFAWRLFAACLGLEPTQDLRRIHATLQCLQQGCCTVSPCEPVGFGPGNPVLKDLVSELSKHGIPESLVEDRARAALKCLGSDAVATALNHRHPWKQLKTLGNQQRFQFVLPSELSSEIAKNKGKPVAPKGKGKGGPKAIQPPSELDPCKLNVLDGTFRAGSKPMPQLLKSQIGPVSSGFVLMTMHDAEPYLSAGQPVSTEPLALVVLSKHGVDLSSALPHSPVTVPCRCTVDQEPVLADAVLVQVGNGLVEEATGAALVCVDTPEVVSFKIMVYKDELQGEVSGRVLTSVVLRSVGLSRFCRCLNDVLVRTAIVLCGTTRKVSPSVTRSWMSGDGSFCATASNRAQQTRPRSFQFVSELRNVCWSRCLHLVVVLVHTVNLVLRMERRS